VYKNYAAVFGDAEDEFQLNVLSTLSATSYTQMGPGFKGLARPANRDFLIRWRAWATENLPYLKVKRDLFTAPGLGRVDGSAHVIDDRGFVFLFPTGVFATDPVVSARARAQAQARPVRAAIPVTRWIGLREAPGQSYRVTEIYPRPDRPLGVVRYGDELLYDL